jgi:glucose dehydrogenase
VLGAAIRNAVLVTKSLVIVAMGAGNLGGGRTLPVGGRPLSKPQVEPTKMRAYDKATGAPLWEYDAPTRPLAAPMSYLHQGKQYIVVAAGSGTSAELIAFSLGS